MDDVDNNNGNGNNIVRLRREGVRKGIYILPSLCSTGSLFCGFFAVIQSVQGSYVYAAWAIMFAGLFDFLDGRIARLTHAESEFGIEYDSLVDLASFGLAPAVLLYTWGLQGFNRIGWLVAFLYFACGALRLARFNVQSNSVEKNWFQGLPIPTAAYVAASMVVFYDYFNVASIRSSYVALVTTIVISLLMVSTVPYRSFKKIHFRSRWSFFWLVGAVVLIFLIALEPRITIFFGTLAYVGTGIVEELITLRKSREIVERIRQRKNREDSSEEAI